jgi:hypothetical protein
MCDVLLPPGVNPTAVKYIYIYIYMYILYQYMLSAFENLVMWKLFGPKKIGCNMWLDVTVYGGIFLQ